METPAARAERAGREGTKELGKREVCGNGEAPERRKEAEKPRPARPRIWASEQGKVGAREGRGRGPQRREPGGSFVRGRESPVGLAAGSLGGLEPVGPAPGCREKPVGLLRGTPERAEPGSRAGVERTPAARKHRVVEGKELKARPRSSRGGCGSGRGGSQVNAAVCQAVTSGCPFFCHASTGWMERIQSALCLVICVLWCLIDAPAQVCSQWWSRLRGKGQPWVWSFCLGFLINKKKW
ncbi:PREDICTED: uncharacterized protein LOC106899946 [Calidris pugnax]|uniref:uncharacterized protein LOC106899946 n=1 Tax=Calidris pugnax TaxID=198806 RepID=UPI00071DF229|nr:PREDICTED: uncharacterized protein LOC106899946 [Calidris pugnax]